MEFFSKIFDELDHFELIQVGQYYADTLFSLLTLHMTVFFGYLALVYFVGPKLSRSQVIWISILYSWFSVGMIAGAFTQAMGIFELTLKLTGLSDYGQFFFMPSLLLVSWLYSIYFMYSCRKNGGTGADT